MSALGTVTRSPELTKGVGRDEISKKRERKKEHERERERGKGEEQSVAVPVPQIVYDSENDSRKKIGGKNRQEKKKGTETLMEMKLPKVVSRPFQQRCLTTLEKELQMPGMAIFAKIVQMFGRVFIIPF